MNNIIDESKINEIRNSVDIVDVIKDYAQLEGKGKNYFGICPFHDDNHPSMSVSQDKQIYKCFSCGAAGNVFKFIEDYENVSFIEAVNIVAKKAGISIDLKGQEKNNNVKNQYYYDIYDLAQKLYSNNINTKDGKEAIEYLLNRKIDKDIIKKFGIGLSLKNTSILSGILQKKGYSEDEILSTGLVNKKGFEFNDIYYNRIMFPLCDLNGKVIGFSGRIYGDTKDTSKYVNTKQTEVFKKGEVLYNYHRAKDKAREKGQIIIMEGFMDVIRASTIGVDNVIATMGTSVTKKQAALIKRMAKEVILCFDGDEAGAHATLSCSNELLEIGITPKVIRLEENLDPDDYIKKYGKDAFLRKLEYPMNIMDFKLSYLKKDKNLDSNVDKAKYINEMILEINKIDDDILKELTINKVAKDMQISEDLLKSKLTKNNNIIHKKKVEKKRLSLIEKAESELLYYILNSKNLYGKISKKIGYIPDEEYRLLYREVSYYYNKYGYINVADIITYLKDKPILMKKIESVISLNINDKITEEGIDDYIKTINKFNIKSQCKELSNKMKNESDILKKTEYAQKILDLEKMFKEM